MSNKNRIAIKWGIIGVANIAIEAVIPAMERSQISQLEAILELQNILIRNYYPEFIISLENDMARQREFSLRYGVNLAMYALSGNYKADQVHAAALVERLGQGNRAMPSTPEPGGR